jgi:hypothetical protein
MKPFLISIAALAALTPVADAAKFTGETSQGRRAVLKTDDQGKPERGRIRWRASCTRGYRYAYRTSFLTPFDFRSRKRLRDEGDYSYLTDDGSRVNAHAWIRARRVTKRKWRGRFTFSGVIRRNGRVVTRCETPVIRWRVTRQ